MNRLGWWLLGIGALLFTVGGYVDALRALEAKGPAVALMALGGLAILAGMKTLERTHERNPT